MVDAPLKGRDANKDDAEDLATFSCAIEGKPWTSEVESDVRNSLAWRSEDPCRTVKVFREGNGDLAVVLAYEEMELGRPDLGYFINYVGVDSRYQNRGRRYDAMQAALVLLAGQAPGADVTWLVHPFNDYSHKLSRSLNAGEPTYPPDDRPFAEYIFVLPDPSPGPGAG